MSLSSLILDNFRTYSHREFSFQDGVNLIYGPNASGKTNLLEAMFFLATGKSFRASTSRHLVSWGESFTTVRGQLKNSQQTSFETKLILPTTSTGFRRVFLIDESVKKRSQYLGQIKPVVFQPDDIRLISGSPSRRRDFFDLLFTSFDWRYTQALSQYHRTLNHRRLVLLRLSQRLARPDELYFWDQSLIKNGQIITDSRQKFVIFANQFFATHSEPQFQRLKIIYPPQPITSESLNSRLNYDIAHAQTSHGAHREDFCLTSSEFKTDNPNLAYWASRGQQRLGVLALKLAQLEFLKLLPGHSPLLMLDDIFSELDSEHQELLINLCLSYQTIITSTFVLPHLETQANLLQLT
ncbi:MAG: DNA replication and repair protein RecF [Candidatus Shapirobacteria bacterium]